MSKCIKKIKQLSNVNIIEDILVVPAENQETLEAVKSITGEVDPLPIEEWFGICQDFHIPPLSSGEANFEPGVEKETIIEPANCQNQALEDEKISDSNREERWQVVQYKLSDIDNLIQVSISKKKYFAGKLQECESLMAVLRNMKRILIDIFKLENQEAEIRKKIKF